MHGHLGCSFGFVLFASLNAGLTSHPSIPDTQGSPLTYFHACANGRPSRKLRSP